MSLLRGDGMGGFLSASSISTGSYSVVAAAAADFNLDMRLDLIVANRSSSSVSLLIGDGVGGFGMPTNFFSSSGPAHVVVGDFNRDQNPDVAVAAAGTAQSPGFSVRVLLNDGLGNFPSNNGYMVGSGPVFLALGDFNRDQRLDIAVANAGTPATAGTTVSILLGDGLGGFPTGLAPTVAVGKRPVAIAVADA